MCLFLSRREHTWWCAWGHSLSHGRASGSRPLGWESAFEAAAAEQPWPHQQKQLMERSQLWHVAVPEHDRVSSAEQFARAGLARPQLLVWVPGKMMQKGREEGKVPFEKWQGQQESSKGEAY